MVEPKLTSLTSTAKFQKLTLLKDYQDAIFEEEQKKGKSEQMKEFSKAQGEDSERLNELILNQAKYLVRLTKATEDD